MEETKFHTDYQTESGSVYVQTRNGLRTSWTKHSKSTHENLEEAIYVSMDFLKNLWNDKDKQFHLDKLNFEKARRQNFQGLGGVIIYLLKNKTRGRSSRVKKIKSDKDLLDFNEIDEPEIEGMP
ncbi:MAG: hypothetical protein AABW46_00985 [Nanoarchaeota archaeon]